MSIERELLIKIKEDMKGLKFTPDFIDEIDRLLAQPEPEQEEYTKGCAEAMRQQVYEAFEAGIKSATSEAWNKEREDAMSEAWNIAQPETKQEPDYYLWHDEFHEQHPTNEGDPDVYPLYIAPPKQEPLSVERIADLWTDINTNSVRNFARAIEKEHGIGVDDE